MLPCDAAWKLHIPTFTRSWDIYSVLQLTPRLRWRGQTAVWASGDQSVHCKRRKNQDLHFPVRQWCIHTYPIPQCSKSVSAPIATRYVKSTIRQSQTMRQTVMLQQLNLKNSRPSHAPAIQFDDHAELCERFECTALAKKALCKYSSFPFLSFPFLLCEVCLIQQCESRLALVPCGHCRFCELCSNDVHRIAHGCPLCRTQIDMILGLY